MKRKIKGGGRRKDGRGELSEFPLTLKHSSIEVTKLGIPGIQAAEGQKNLHSCRVTAWRDRRVCMGIGRNKMGSTGMEWGKPFGGETKGK